MEKAHTEDQLVIHLQVRVLSWLRGLIVDWHILSVPSRTKITKAIYVKQSGGDGSIPKAMVCVVNGSTGSNPVLTAKFKNYENKYRNTFNRMAFNTI